MLDASKDLVRGLGETLGKKYPSGTHPVLQCFGKVVNDNVCLSKKPLSIEADQFYHVIQS